MVDGAFENLGNINIDIRGIKVFQDQLSMKLNSVRKDIDSLRDEIASLSSAFKIDDVGINTFVANMQGQFAELQNTARETEEIIQSFFQLVERSNSRGVINFDNKKLEEAEKLLDRLDAGRKASKIDYEEKWADNDDVDILIQNMDKLVQKYKELETEEKTLITSKGTTSYFKEQAMAIAQ